MFFLLLLLMPCLNFCALPVFDDADYAYCHEAAHTITQQIPENAQSATILLDLLDTIHAFCLFDCTLYKQAIACNDQLKIMQLKPSTEHQRKLSKLCAHTINMAKKRKKYYQAWLEYDQYIKTNAPGLLPILHTIRNKTEQLMLNYAHKKSLDITDLGLKYKIQCKQAQEAFCSLSGTHALLIKKPELFVFKDIEHSPDIQKPYESKEIIGKQTRTHTLAYGLYMACTLFFKICYEVLAQKIAHTFPDGNVVDAS